MLPAPAIRRALRREEGQALVMGALALLILSLAVLTTVNLGHTVNERVRLQNTADASAYSMAAMEARAFNFYAFSNRTQVSHYVSAMLWQSILSFTYFAEAFLVDVYGVMKSFNPCVNASGLMAVFCTALKLVPYVGQLINMISQVMDMYRRFVAEVVLPTIRQADPDRWIGRYVIPAYRGMNGVLAAASQATLYATMTHVFGTSSEVLAANDVNVNSAGSRALSGALSGCILNRAHYREANGDFFNRVNPFGAIQPDATSDGSKEARAKKVLGNVTNATRFACDRPGGWCAPGWVTARRPEDILPLPANLGVIRQILGLLPEWKWGQTKMLSYSFSRGTLNGGNFIRDWSDPPNAPTGMLAQGDAVGADDLYTISIGPRDIGLGPFSIKNPFACDKDDDPLECWGDPWKGKDDSNRRKLPFRRMLKTSIWAMSDDETPGGLHWRLVYPSRRGMYPDGATRADAPRGYPGTNMIESRIGLSEVQKSFGPFGAFKMTIWVANVRMVRDQNHSWQGVVPFSHFEPGQYAAACGAGVGSGGRPSLGAAAGREKFEFNQPSSFVILNKNPEELKNAGDRTGAGNNKPALLNRKGEFEFAFTEPTKLTLDNTRKTFLGAEGLNVVSRAQTYYHRPGNWQEQPNFFNPYWRPRLASVLQGKDNLPLVGDMINALPGPVRNIPQKFITH